MRRATSTALLLLTCGAVPACRSPRVEPGTTVEEAVAPEDVGGYLAAMVAALERLDQPLVAERIFFPRPDPGEPGPPGSRDLEIPVADGVTLHARLHPAGPGAPLVLLFHGNGEIVADYDDLAGAYRELGASLLVVDYRGYGRSGGEPLPSALIRDSHRVLSYLRDRVLGPDVPPIVVFGRSLGSAPAIHLAATAGDLLAGLIVESGFARTLPLLALVGVPVARLGLTEADGFSNREAMRLVRIPTLLLHADEDRIIPYEDARLNFDACGAADKRLVTIEGADHNSIAAYGGRTYWGAIAELVRGAATARRGGGEER
ncbi:MAG: alpha/beta hydrolase [Deltaproteobacteria bacterium]|nr:alpha/beta hydrolase [Deltaproteobacteria bacterium]